MSLVTRSNIEAIQNLSSNSHFVMSCFADLTVLDGIKRHWKEELKQHASRFRQLYSSDELAAKEFNQNYQDVVLAIEAIDQSKSSGVAVYSIHSQGQLLVLPFSIPVNTDIVVDHEVYLVPILEAYFHQAQQYLAIVSDLQQTQLIQAWAGGQKVVKQWQSDIPKKQHSSGERGGWAQSKIAQHRDEWVDQYLHEIIDSVNWAVEGHPSLRLILLGQHAHTQHLRNKLPAPLQAKVIAEHSCAEPHSPSVVMQQVHQLVMQLNQQFMKEQLLELDRRRETGLGIATGTEDVLAALDHGQLENRGCLLLGPDPREDCWRCSSCRNLYLDQVAVCPRCQSPCKKANTWEEVMLRALRHDWKVVTYPSSSSLYQVGGMALLCDRAEQPLPRRRSQQGS